MKLMGVVASIALIVLLFLCLLALTLAWYFVYRWTKELQNKIVGKNTEDEDETES